MAKTLKNDYAQVENTVRLRMREEIVTHENQQVLQKRIWDGFEFIYTPKHGSWLNMAEIELNVLISQCLNRRIDNIQTTTEEVKAWQQHRNNKETAINWQFTNDKARVKLRRLLSDN